MSLLAVSCPSVAPTILPARRWQPRPRPRPRLRALQLADLAIEALIDEALLSPKPALVDQRGSGAHRDLDLACLLRSARALHPAFLEMATLAAGREPDQVLREQLALIGREGERHMLAVTGGSNTHRGAIWVIGLLLAARAIGGAAATARQIAALAGRIAQHEDRFAPRLASHGMHVCERYGVPGARGQARAGFPHVVDIGLPALAMARARAADETCARLDALMAIMCSLDDTCLLHRAGLPALRAAQSGAAAVLALGGSASVAGRRALLSLDAQLLTLRASPGGSADLLAACLFLDRAQRPGATRGAQSSLR
jgi:triphosphoribosyl-dephospho-CoA synthase